MSEKSNHTEFETKMKEVYMKLSQIDGPIIRDKIIAECGITKPIFYNWMDGKTPVPKLCRIVVANHLKVSETELFAEQLKKELAK
jgi:hypothetical protein